MIIKYFLTLILVSLFLSNLGQIRDSIYPNKFKDNTYLLFVDINDSALCNKDSVSKLTQGLNEFYFTKKGNIISKPYHKSHGDTLYDKMSFLFGTYSVSNEGISYQLNKVYTIKLKYEYSLSSNKYIDITDYNAGKTKKLSDKARFISKNNCVNFPYGNRGYARALFTNEKIRPLTRRDDDEPFGQVLEKNPEYEEEFLDKFRQILIFKDL
jgi:hypothetical protein